MPDRVLMDADGIRVSKVGYDVKNANESQLIFNSRWSVMKRLLFGSFYFNIPPPPGPGQPGLPNNYTVYYGRNFTYRPLLFSIVSVYNSFTGPNGGLNRQHIGTATYFVFYNPSPPIRYTINVRNDHFSLQVNSSLSNSGTYTNARLFYAVWDHGLG